MSVDAWNKITQTHDLFKKIIAPLKEHLGINFGYMIVFNDGRYYQIIEDLECLKKWVTNLETSHIFCARNVTTYFDQPYNFTIWPEEPTCTAMEIYKEYGMWNGITVSKASKDYTKLYWFTKENAEDGWHKWFIRNKQICLEFIKYFNAYKKQLYCAEKLTTQKLFKLNNGFSVAELKSEHIAEGVYLNKCVQLFKRVLIINNANFIADLSLREKELLHYICNGYTIKMASAEMSIAYKTAEHYLEKVKAKTNCRFKSDLVKFFHSSMQL